MAKRTQVIGSILQNRLKRFINDRTGIYYTYEHGRLVKHTTGLEKHYKALKRRLKGGR